MIASILKIDEPPASLEVVDCESPFTTDVLTTCAVRISPADFPRLLSGYEFEESETLRSSHSVGSSKVGPEFKVTTQYAVWPKEFIHGGAVHIFTNSTKDMAIIDEYIE